MNIRVSLLLCCLSLASVILPLAADDSPQTHKTRDTRLNLPDLIRLAVERNPDLKAARLKWGAALQSYPQAKALPDPMIDYAYFAESVETRVGPQKHRIGIAQPFPFPGTLKSAGKVALDEIKIAQINHERALRDLIVDLKLSFHELGYLQRAITITEQNHNLMQHAITLANTNYAKNEGTLNDVLKAQSQQAQLEYDLILLRELVEVETAQLNALLDLPSSTPASQTVNVPMQPLTADYETIEEQALTNRQELLIAAKKIEQTKHRIGLTRNKNLPTFKASLSTIVTDEAENPNMTDSGKDPVLIGLSMTLPWNVSKNSAAVKAAELNHEAAIQHQKSLENKTRATLRRIYFRLQNSRRLVTLYEKTLIPQAKKSMEIAETWEVDGQKSLSGFLETQSVWLNFNLARMRAITDYNQNLAKLERLIGGTLPSTKEDEK